MTSRIKFTVRIVPGLIGCLPLIILLGCNNDYSTTPTGPTMAQREQAKRYNQRNKEFSGELKKISDHLAITQKQGGNQITNDEVLYTLEGLAAEVDLLIAENKGRTDGRSNISPENHQLAKEVSLKIGILDVYAKIDDSWFKKEIESNADAEIWWSMGDPRVFRNQIERLSSIDASRCPTDFQAAFEEYLMAMNDHNNRIASSVGWGSWSLNMATGGSATLIPTFMNLPKLVERKRNAELKMKRAAIKHGLEMERVEPKHWE